MMLVPTVMLARLRTAADPILRRAALRRADDEAWKAYDPVQERLKLRLKMSPSRRTARFAHNVVQAGLPRPVRYLEIGAWDGGSLAFVHTLLKGDVEVTVVDPFESYIEVPSHAAPSRKVFDANVAALGASACVRVLRGRSIDHLQKLIDAKEAFDLIYIDGSHHMLDVMVDAVLGWRLLRPSGLMIFDDYYYRLRRDGQDFRPKPAIDAFIGMMGGALEIVDLAGQVFVRKVR